jgi:peptidylprolyl isomerase
MVVSSFSLFPSPTRIFIPANSHKKMTLTLTPKLKSADMDEVDGDSSHSSNIRRALLAAAAGAVSIGSSSTSPASAIGFNPLRPKASLYVVDTRTEVADSVRTTQVDTPVATLSSEYALLRVLPVKNPIFRIVVSNLETLSALRFVGEDTKDSTWKKAQQAIVTALTVLNNKRPQLEPVFNPEDSTALSIYKAERGEILLDELQQELIQLVNATNQRNLTLTFDRQQEALLTLGFIGELLVKEFPYKVPGNGMFSFLPRLLGRAKVTFRIKRKGTVMSNNVTIVADGYTAPITAGNFVDLCMRGFYNGLPIKTMNKKFGPLSDQLTTSINVLGSYNEGFYDPLTAKLRQIPLEIIRLEKGSGLPKLSYSSRGLSESSLSDLLEENDMDVVPTEQSKPLLTFETRSIVAWNHPDRRVNGGSSEFFAIQPGTIPDEKRKLLDGEYAPFGYIIGGRDFYDSLQPGDIIESATVDDFGQLNLVKLRKSNIQEAASAGEVAK